MVEQRLCNPLMGVRFSLPAPNAITDAMSVMTWKVAIIPILWSDC